MDLTNDFRVAVPIEHAWSVLTDLEGIAPCMPGAQLQEVEGDTFRGVVKVKVGPVQAQYKGAVSIVERDDEAHVAVLRAEGRETRGQGTASATITARLEPDGTGTTVAITTDLAITGRVAQFGRSVLADVKPSGLLDQFVTNLEASVLAEATASPADPAQARASETTAPPETAGDEPDPAAPDPRPKVRTITSPEPEPVDMMATAGSPLLKRAVPALALLVVGYLLGRFGNRRRR